jgi:hypothetical protein
MVIPIALGMTVSQKTSDEDGLPKTRLKAEGSGYLDKLNLSLDGYDHLFPFLHVVPALRYVLFSITTPSPNYATPISVSPPTSQPHT